MVYWCGTADKLLKWEVLSWMNREACALRTTRVVCYYFEVRAFSFSLG